LDLKYIRNQFPALSSGYTYLDNAGGSQTLKGVSQKISEYLTTSNVQFGGTYSVSKLAEKKVREAIRAMAVFVNAEHPSEIIAGPSTSMLIRILSLSLSENFQPGDEIIITNSDHEANVSPWTDLQKMGVIIRTWRINTQTLKLETEDLKNLLTDRTRLVAFCHVSNILGTINPVKEITQIAHARKALVCVDGVAYAPHRLIDVRDWDVDFYCFSTYKVFGPHYAIMYGKKKHLLQLPGINHYFIDDVPLKFQPGNLNFELTYSLLSIVQYLEMTAIEHHCAPEKSIREKLAFTYDLFARNEEEIAEKLLAFLRSKKTVTIIGEHSSDRTKRVATISFIVKGFKSDVITTRVDPHSIGIRFGDFYAKKLIAALGLFEYNGVIRVSMVHYNTAHEIDKLMEVFDNLF